MAQRRIIAVMGATGAQGGALTQAILDDAGGEYAVRAITRNPNTDKAKRLADAGAEVVAADLNDAPSIEHAFEGAYGAFCVTFFWEHFSPEREYAQVRNMAQAAKNAALKHVVWSTLEDTRKWVPVGDDRMPTLQDKYKVPHFDAKGEANAEFSKAGVPTTFLLTSFYWENFIFFGMGPQKGPDGRYAITMPMGNARLPGVAVDDIGKCAYAIFRHPDYIGKTVGIAGEHLTGEQMASALGKALGMEVAYNDVPPEVFRAFDFPGADDLGNMFQFKRDFNDDFCGARDLATARALNPEMQTFETWLGANKHRIPVE